MQTDDEDAYITRSILKGEDLKNTNQRKFHTMTADLRRDLLSVGWIRRSSVTVTDTVTIDILMIAVTVTIALVWLS